MLNRYVKPLHLFWERDRNERLDTTAADYSCKVKAAMAQLEMIKVRTTDGPTGHQSPLAVPKGGWSIDTRAEEELSLVAWWCVCGVLAVAASPAPSRGPLRQERRRAGLRDHDGRGLTTLLVP